MADRINIEIEFKCLIDKAKYDALIKNFNISKDQIKTQTNYYFDTKDLMLRKKHVMCRIRQKGDQYKITVKTKTPDNDNLETHYFLTNEEAKLAIENGLDGKYANYPDKLFNVATLTTNRVCLEYRGGKLFLDESKYGSITDYEIEYEVIDKKNGEIIFDEFLKENNIVRTNPISKSSRCLKEACYNI